MSTSKAIALLGLVSAAAALDLDASEAGFNAFVAKYEKKYETAKHRAVAYEHFAKFMAKAKLHQAMNKHASFGLNRFADLGDEAKRLLLGRKAHPRGAAQGRSVAAMAAPPSNPPMVDWRKKGGVTPPVSFAVCAGGDEALAVTANVEGVNFATNGRLVPLSAQQVLDCDQDSCQQGTTIGAIQRWVMGNGGKIATAASYPNDFNQPSLNNCSKSYTTGATVKSWSYLPHNETEMAASVALNGPIGIAVDAQAWETYQSGVLTSCPFEDLDHVATVVGYDDVATPPYWVVKNAWGKWWGEDGYIRIAKGSNQCGIANDPWTVKVAKTSL